MITRLRELIKDQLLVMNAQKIVVSNNNVKGIFGFFVTLLSLFVKGLSKLLQAMLLD